VDLGRIGRADAVVFVEDDEDVHTPRAALPAAGDAVAEVSATRRLPSRSLSGVGILSQAQPL
jgi:hypothetical protein